MKRILVGISGTPATPCKIEYAIELAKRHGAKLDMLSVIDVDRLAHVGPVPIGGTHFADRIRDDRVRQSHENAEKAIAAFKVKADAAGIDYTHVMAEGDPFELLAAHWRYNDLCLLGLRESPLLNARPQFGQRSADTLQPGSRRGGLLLLQQQFCTL